VPGVTGVALKAAMSAISGWLSKKLQFLIKPALQRMGARTASGTVSSKYLRKLHSLYSPCSDYQYPLSTSFS
jgi:hypothetical protein